MKKKLSSDYNQWRKFIKQETSGDQFMYERKKTYLCEMLKLVN